MISTAALFLSGSTLRRQHCFQRTHGFDAMFRAEVAHFRINEQVKLFEYFLTRWGAFEVRIIVHRKQKAYAIAALSAE